MSNNVQSNEDLKMNIPMKAPMKAPMKPSKKTEKKKKSEEKKPKRNLNKDDFEDANAGFCIQLANQLNYLYWLAAVSKQGKNKKANEELDRKKKSFTKFINALKDPDFDLASFRKKMWMADLLAEAKSEEKEEDDD